MRYALLYCIKIIAYSVTEQRQ